MFQMRKLACVVLPIFMLSGCSDSKTQVADDKALKISEEQARAIVGQYADVALATYEDGLSTAKELHKAAELLVTRPSIRTLENARKAWVAARVPYMQSEVFRFGNPVVDDWEGELNAWPLDEGLIDYVDTSSYGHEMGNAGATANIVSNSSLQVGSEKLDTSMLSTDLLSSLNELGGSEANVATGYHAVEFLLWGQDLNGSGPGAGERPFTDYAKGPDCTNGHCERRGEYLLTATSLLVKDLEYMVGQWQPETEGNYRQTLMAESVSQGLRKMLFGMGSLALGELAGERMKVALEANSTEDEQDCFSDNTHNSHFYNAQGIRNVYTGTYARINGSEVSGPSLSSWLSSANPELFSSAQVSFDATRDALQSMVDSAEGGVAFDQMIASDNEEGNAIVQAAISTLVAQTEVIEQVANELGIQQLNPDNADHEF